MSGSFCFATPAPLESPAGRVAADLESLRAGIAGVPATSLYHHVTRIPARFPNVRDLPANDFARWVGDALQLPEVGERLAFVGTIPVASLEDLRASLLGVLDRVSGRARKREASEGAAFHFIDCRIVVSPLDVTADDPTAVVEAWPQIDLGSAFYHLVGAPLIGRADQALIPWLRERGARGLADAAQEVVSAGRPLSALHREIGSRWRRLTIGRRLLRRAEAPDAEREREAHDVIARLVGRLRGRGGERNDGGGAP